MQCPGPVRPDLPALCFAEDWVISCSFMDETLYFWSYTSSISRPGSITTRTPSIVIAVSAILDAKMNLWRPKSWNTFFWSAGVIFPWSAKTVKTFLLSLFSYIFTSSLIYSILEQKHNKCPLNSLFILLLSYRTSSSIALQIFLIIWFLSPSLKWV